MVPQQPSAEAIDLSVGPATPGAPRFTGGGTPGDAWSCPGVCVVVDSSGSFGGW